MHNHRHSHEQVGHHVDPEGHSPCWLPHLVQVRHRVRKPGCCEHPEQVERHRIARSRRQIEPAQEQEDGHVFQVVEVAAADALNIVVGSSLATVKLAVFRVGKRLGRKYDK